jgi:hypothetical protein
LVRHCLVRRDTQPEFHSPERSQQSQFDDEDLANAIDITAPSSPNNAERVARVMDQLEPPMPFHSDPPPVALAPRWIVDAGSAHGTDFFVGSSQ